MKGTIFNELENMVTEVFGAATWERLIAESALKTKDGVFIGPKTYPDEDLFALVGTASKISGKPADELVTAFGRYLLPAFAKRYPNFFPAGMSAKTFLASVDRVIHVEVRKLQPDSVLPELRYEDPGPNRLVILYSSARKLCDLAVGLIDGAGTHFKESIKQTHATCMKRGDAVCRIECEFGAR